MKVFLYKKKKHWESVLPLDLPEMKCSRNKRQELRTSEAIKAQKSGAGDKG